jgi:hypothetical protein
MATHVHTTRPDPGRNLAFERIDLDAHPDAALLRLCALLGRLQTLTEELDSVIASLPARTLLGRRAKELAL